MDESWRWQSRLPSYEHAQWPAERQVRAVRQEPLSFGWAYESVVSRRATTVSRHVIRGLSPISIVALVRKHTQYTHTHTVHGAWSSLDVIIIL